MTQIDSSTVDCLHFWWQCGTIRDESRLERYANRIQTTAPTQGAEHDTGEFKEFPLPVNLLKDGKLVLTFDAVGGSPSQVAAGSGCQRSVLVEGLKAKSARRVNVCNEWIALKGKTSL